MTFRAVLCRELGSPHVLRVEDCEPGPLGPGEVRLAIEAAGVNFPDLLMVAGGYQFKPPLPFVPGMESAGRVIETGADATRFRIGDRVIARQRTGAFAEQAVVGQEALSPLPNIYSFEEGATFFVGFSTAYNALVTRGQVRAGERVLVTGAGGGVGLAAVALAAHLGAIVVAAASSAEKRAAAKAAGAAHVVDSHARDFDAQVRAATGGLGADVIYDPVGMTPLTMIRCAAFAARILIIGFTGGTIPDYPANRVLLKCVSLIGVRAGEWSRHFTPVRGAETEALLTLAGKGAIRPHVTRRFALADAASALRALADRQAIGRMVIVP
jgi:NADPH2:quinone reductase